MSTVSVNLLVFVSRCVGEALAGGHEATRAPRAVCRSSLAAGHNEANAGCSGVVHDRGRQTWSQTRRGGPVTPPKRRIEERVRLAHNGWRLVCWFPRQALNAATHHPSDCRTDRRRVSDQSFAACAVAQEQSQQIAREAHHRGRRGKKCLLTSTIQLACAQVEEYEETRFVVLIDEAGLGEPPRLASSRGLRADASHSAQLHQPGGNFWLSCACRSCAFTTAAHLELSAPSGSSGSSLPSCVRSSGHCSLGKKVLPRIAAGRSWIGAKLAMGRLPWRVRCLASLDSIRSARNRTSEFDIAREMGSSACSHRLTSSLPCENGQHCCCKAMCLGKFL
jgi:hypothetical protein